MQQDSDNSSRLSHKSALDVQFTYRCEESYSVNKPALAARRELAGLVRSVHGGGAGRERAVDVNGSLFGTSKEKETTIQEKQMNMKVNDMQISQTYRADSAPKMRESALRGMMQRLGSTLLVCTLVMAATGSTRAAEARNEAAVRALGDGFAKAFVQKNADLRASLFAEDGTFVTPQGDFLQGHVAMVKEFGTEAQAVNGSTQAAFSNYRIRFIKPDVAVVDARLTVRNVNGPDATIIPVIPINFFYVAVRQGDHWLIKDGRAHFAPAPPNGMTDHGMAAHN